MMNKVEVITDLGEVLTLPLQGPTDYSVQDIEGLDPVNATFVSAPFAQLDGEQYQASRREKRNIVITLGYEPDYMANTVQVLRKRLYGIFMPKSRVLLRFYQDGEPTVVIYGRVETFDSPKFSPEPIAVISLICFEPDFFVAAPVVISGSTTSGSTETTVPYIGSVETGIKFQLFVNRTVNSFTIFHRLPDNSVRSLLFSTTDPLVAGDTLTISTVPGSKYVRLLRDGVTTSRLYDMTAASIWTSLFPGTNKIRVFSGGAAIPYQIDYITRFGGL